MRGATGAIVDFAQAIITSIHAPHAWGDVSAGMLDLLVNQLQSTPHMRGATVSVGT